ncbi:hypothetical protein ACRDNQ_17215 [Palleronia sp. KMU-117]|uniref:hypothetical protein n=1 Tax=Palleronia sp. KMU-117 TaxID=3434108 RepID=UPI003D7061E8
MIATLKPGPTHPSRTAVEALIEDLGPRRVLMIAAAALLREMTRPRPPSAHELSDHLRRDIGLAPHAPPPLPRGPVL